MDANGQSEWHSIRPWTPRLGLQVREITSVSATFILSSPLSEPDSLASLGLLAVDGPTDGGAPIFEFGSDTGAGENAMLTYDPKPIISNALAKGLSVNVNGSPWQRVLLRIDDKADEAVIIIYGLMPGRQYDIDLGLVQGDQSLRRQVVTEDSDHSAIEPAGDPNHQNTDTLSVPETISSQHSNSSASTISNSHLPLPTPPESPGPSTSNLSVEDHTSQLQRTLSILHNERSSLTTSLKTARRDAQKAEAALRGQVDTFRRAGEKHAAAEGRAKQKVLALQEVVKRAQAATAEIEALVLEVEAALPALQETKQVKESEYEGVLAEADRVKSEMETETENGRKKVERGENELAALANRIERIGAKREKLEGEGGTLQELEDELRDVQRQIEEVEIASNSTSNLYAHGYPYEFEGIPGGDDGVGMDNTAQEEGDAWDSRFSYLPVQRSRGPSLSQQTQPLGPTGRPPVGPIGRPSSSHFSNTPGSGSTTSSSRAAHRNSLDPPFVYQSPSQIVTPQSFAQNSSYPAPTSLPAPLHQIQLSPQAPINLKSPKRNGIHNQSNSTSHSPPLSGTGAATSSTTTTLSSKAPPFEPGRPLPQPVRAHIPPVTNDHSSGNGLTPRPPRKSISKSSWAKGPRANGSEVAK